MTKSHLYSPALELHTKTSTVRKWNLKKREEVCPRNLIMLPQKK